MAAVEDLITTRLELVGLSEYTSGLRRIVSAFGVLREGMDEAARSSVIMGVAFGAAAIGIAAKLVEVTKQAGEEDAAIQRASLSFEQYGNSFPEAALEAFGNRIQDTTAIARGQAIAMAGLMGAYGMTRQQAEALTPAILNAAEALKSQGVSAESLTTRIARALERARMGDMGGFSGLRRLGIIVNEAKAAADPLGSILDALNKKGGDQAAMFRKTLPGALDTFHNSITRLGEDVGRVFEGPMKGAVEMLTRFIDLIDKMPGGPQLVAGGAVAAIGGGLIKSAASLISAWGVIKGLGAAATKVAAGAAPAAAGPAATAAGGIGAATTAGLLAGGALQGSSNAIILRAIGVDPSKMPAWLQALITPGELLKGGKAAEKQADTTEKLAKSMDDLRNSNLELVKNMQNYLGGAGGAYIRDVLGDSAIVEAFARGIA